MERHAHDAAVAGAQRKDGVAFGGRSDEAIGGADGGSVPTDGALESHGRAAQAVHASATIEEVNRVERRLGADLAVGAEADGGGGNRQLEGVAQLQGGLLREGGRRQIEGEVVTGAAAQFSLKYELSGAVSKPEAGGDFEDAVDTFNLRWRKCPPGSRDEYSEE